MADNVACQLSFCTFQMDALLAGMQKAFQSVTTLALDVIRQKTKRTVTDDVWNNVEQRQQGQQQHVLVIHGGEAPQQQSEVTSLESDLASHNVKTSPKDVGVISGHLFAMLAAAVPNLTELRLNGCCWDASLHVFGACCPQLVTLRAEAFQVSDTSLLHFGTYLPNIETVDIFTSNIDNVLDVVQMGKFVDAVLLATQPCTNLTELQISFPDVDSGRVPCKPESWSLLPHTLKSFDSNGLFEETEQFMVFVRRLTHLCLGGRPFRNLLQLVHTFPLLEKLKVMYADDDPAGFMFDCEDSAVLKERFLGGKFQLECPNLALAGTYQEIQDLLVWLPPWPVRGLLILFNGNARMQCLGQLSRVFSNLEVLTLQGEQWPDNQSMDCGFFTPLATCAHLEHLAIFMTTTITTPVIMHVCTSLTVLKRVNLMSPDGFDENHLMAELRKIGRNVKIVICDEDADDAVLAQNNNW